MVPQGIQGIVENRYRPFGQSRKPHDHDPQVRG
jgi:hypothetical protein